MHGEAPAQKKISSLNAGKVTTSSAANPATGSFVKTPHFCVCGQGFTPQQSACAQDIMNQASKIVLWFHRLTSKFTKRCEKQGKSDSAAVFITGLQGTITGVRPGKEFYTKEAETKLYTGPLRNDGTKMRHTSKLHCEKAIPSSL